MKHEKQSGIYCIENIVNHKKYIGQSKDIKDRWRRHIGELRHGNHYNSYFQNAWNKYGEENFQFSVLELCDEKELDDREKYYISLYDTTNRDLGYNRQSGGQLSKTHSEESKKKMSESTKASYTEELREKRRQAALKQWSDPAFKQKMSGDGNGMYGKTHTEEARNKISEANKGRVSWRRDITPILCVELNKIFTDSTEAGKELNIAGYNVLRVCQGKRKTCGGLHFEFVTEENNEKII